MTTQTTYAARPYMGEPDLEPIRDLLNTCSAADHTEDSYAVQDLRDEFAHPNLDPMRDLRLWRDAGGRVRGFGQIWIARDGTPVDGGAYIRVHPDVRADGLGDTILDWAAERLREAGRERGLPVRLRGWAREHDTYMRALLDAHGFAVVRYFFKMARPLDAPIAAPQFPAGFVLRHVADDEDVVRWVETFNQSFIDHWNHHPQTVEGHRHWLQSPHYRAKHDLIAVAPDGTFAAFCFCLINPEENAREGRNEGWIDVLGTRRGFRKIGLGHAMLLAGLQRLKADGVAAAVLGVDAENPTGALRLYESVGFTQVHTSVSYAKDLS